MNARIARVEAFVITLPRDTPYLGPLGDGETVNARGYFVRRGNRTIYPTVDRSVLLRITAEDGLVGWGETYGLVAPDATTAIVDDVLGPCLAGRDADDPAAVWDDLYDLMRVRGCWGGFWCDALAAVDMALWDLLGKRRGESVARLLAPGRMPATTIPAYVSGLPRATLAERVALAQDFVRRGHDAIKYAAAVSHDGIVEEMAALRRALGPQVKLMVDLHWKFSAEEAVALIDRLAPHRPYFVEAPCAPEDLDGQAAVAARVPVPVALGEEWHTEHVARLRFQRRAMSIVQPEVAHCGPTQFMRIGHLAQAHGVRVIPHATIGIGVFMAASLQAAAALPNVPMHEYQHSVFDRHRHLLDTTMRCEAGVYTVPDGPGLGIEPTADLLALARPSQGRA